jgi:hypothetical protein
MSTFNLLLETHSIKLAGAAEANLWHQVSNNDSLSTATIAASPAKIAALMGTEGATPLVFTSGQLAATEAADQAAVWTTSWTESGAARARPLPREVTIPRPASPGTEPPRVAELLVSWCIKKRYRDALRDDLDEVFQRDLSKGMTVARARLRYRGSALHSITPQL